jgi:hypothetical protein
MNRRSLLKIAAACPLVLLGTTEATKQASCADECENCGMVDVPLDEGFCVGCTCAHCGTHGSMNDMGWCDACEEQLWSTTA